MPILQAVAFFRLGKKIDHLCHEVLHRMKLSYPCTLADWDGLSNRKSLFTMVTTGDDEDSILGSREKDRKATEIFANLADEFQTQIILPALYASLSSQANVITVSQYSLLHSFFDGYTFSRVNISGEEDIESIKDY